MAWGSRFLITICFLVCIPDKLAAQWLQQPGEWWVQAKIYHQDTREQFGPDRSRIPIFDNGHSITTSLYITSAIGIIRGLDMWLQAPLHNLKYNDISGNRVSSGLGEPRLYVRIGPELLGINAIPIALRGGVKFAGSFETDAEIVPLGEGQRDWELLVELGHSLYPAPAYIAAWAGYRWREENAENAKKPGDEFFGYLTATAHTGNLIFAVAAEYLSGRSATILGFEIPTGKREFLQITPSLGWDTGIGIVDFGVRLPLAGRNLPTGPSLSLGYLFTVTPN